jgi:preprotein translocase subunit SecA
MEEGEPIEHNLISRAIENAQSKVEGQNFDIRKQLLEYDDVMNQQREVIYEQRREALTGKGLKTAFVHMINDKAKDIAYIFSDEKAHPEEWDWKGIDNAVFKQFNFRLDPLSSSELERLDMDELAELISDKALKDYGAKEVDIGPENIRLLEREVMLQKVDNLWKDHLFSMDHLKEGIGLRGYAQQHPLVIYKKEGFEMFQDMIDRIQEETVSFLFHVQIARPERIRDFGRPKEQDLTFSGGGDQPPRSKPVKRDQKKVGRNAPCPCGSGKKFKKCCGNES